jgi:hypothetical protein
MLENDGIAAGDCMRYITSVNNPLGEDDVYKSNVGSKACVALANSFQPSRVKYTKVYNYVKKNLRDTVCYYPRSTSSCHDTSPLDTG